MYLRTLAALAGFLTISYADTLTLRNGRTVNGSYLGGDARQIKMVVGERVEQFSVADVVRLEFGSAASTPPPTTSMRETREPRENREPREMRETRETADSPPPPQPAPRSTDVAPGAEVPAGTTLTIRMIDSVDSERDRPGKTLRASLDEPVMINGEVIIPRGADVVAKLVEDKQSGKIEGKTILTLDLESIIVNGRQIDIATQEITQSSGSRTKKSAGVIGGLTALGAIIGGIAGGGKGAAVGAVSGAGVGTAAQVMTKGEQVKIPSETRLTFTLQQPLRI